MAENISESIPSLRIYREPQVGDALHLTHQLALCAGMALAEHGLADEVQEDQVTLEIGLWTDLSPLVTPASIADFHRRNRLPRDANAMNDLRDHLDHVLPAWVREPITVPTFPVSVYEPSVQSRWVNLGIRPLNDVQVVWDAIVRYRPGSSLEGVRTEVPEAGSVRGVRVAATEKRRVPLLDPVTQAVVDAAMRRLQPKFPESTTTYGPLKIEPAEL